MSDYDLTKVGPVREDVKVMVRNSESGTWIGPFDLVAISGPSSAYPFAVAEDGDIGSYKYAKIYTKKGMTHAEVFKVLRDGYLLRHVAGLNAMNYWSTGWNPLYHQMIHVDNYTGTGSDEWLPLEVDA